MSDMTTPSAPTALQPSREQDSGRRQKWFLRPWVIVPAVLALLFGLNFLQHGVVSQVGGGFGHYGREKPAYYAAARASLDQWIRSQGFTKADKYPGLFTF